MTEEKKGQGEVSAEHAVHEDKEKKKHGGKEGIAELEAALTKAKEEARENYDRLLRSAAELENYKKRVAKEKADLIRYGNEELLKALLPVIDNLERALEHAQRKGNEEGIRGGVEMTLQHFLQILQRFGVTPITAEGERFDPARHEAVMEQASDAHTPGQVISELEKGYVLNDRLVRPARVVVAKAREATGSDTESEKEEGGE